MYKLQGSGVFHVSGSLIRLVGILEGTIGCAPPAIYIYIDIYIHTPYYTQYPLFLGYHVDPLLNFLEKPGFPKNTLKKVGVWSKGYIRVD